MVKTTTDCIKKAEAILARAAQVKSKEDHGKVWDEKADLLNKINDSLASGAFNGEALDELRSAKNILYKAESKAGQQAQKTYMNK